MKFLSPNKSHATGREVGYQLIYSLRESVRNLMIHTSNQKINVCRSTSRRLESRPKALVNVLLDLQANLVLYGPLTFNVN